MEWKLSLGERWCNGFALLAALLIFTACSRSGSSGEPPEPAVPPNAEQQVLTRSLFSEPASLDPHVVNNSGIHVILDTYEGLLSYNREGDLIPAVAERWESEDGRVYTFYLRMDALWSNGDPLTASDFVYSWRRLMDPSTGSPHVTQFINVGVLNAADIVRGVRPPESLGVEALDPHTLRVTLDSPSAYFPHLLAKSMTFPVHRSSIEKHGNNWTSAEHSVSNGPFKLQEWLINEKIVLAKNENYSASEDTVLSQVIYLLIPSSNTETKRYLADELNISYQIPMAQVDRIREIHNEEFFSSERLATRVLEFNITRPPFDNAKLRKALAYAVDRTILTQSRRRLGERPLFHFTPSGLHGFTPEMLRWAEWSQAEREARARELYASAGYSEDNPLEVTLLTPASGDYPKEALAIVSMWRNVLGARARVDVREMQAIYVAGEQGDYEVNLGSFGADYLDASAMIGRLVSGSGDSWSGFANARFDALVAEGNRTLDSERRSTLYNRAERILAEEMPVVPLYQTASARLVKPRVSGYWQSPFDTIPSKDISIGEPK
ncbi:peptide ABC transporter substrate-binding protein [Microbulbifer guangxiensis]|uniref:peptide ABC transporter substrate-binding protein n=1 Tax=Microbulbifer guangxiensis TaxID=2904249 RepID=UPI001F453034|nr:peptide ABC transporter substrate-binding protein [Microbulbifer guangxiensis]